MEPRMELGMEIALHLGAHLTDEDNLVRCLMRNRAGLAAQGIAVPSPGAYRQQLRQLAHDLQDQPTDAQTQEMVLDGLLEADDVRRVVFSSEQLLAMHRWVLGGNMLYPAAGERVTNFAHLFPDAKLHLYMAIRDPATFIPALAHDERAGGIEQALKDTDPLALRWSETLARIVSAVPGVSVTVWRDEDTPLLWPEILRTVSGHDPQTELEGWFAWYWTLMTPKRHEAMRRWFAANPSVDDLHRRKVLSAMLDKFALPEELEGGPLLPGWDAEYVDVMSELYDQDCDLIATLPGVTLIEP